MNYCELSKTLSHALRHEPWLYELELDNEGWVEIKDVLASLRRESGSWACLSSEDLARMITSADKRRHEIRDGRIRALYGHSITGKLKKIRANPPGTLFHGTSPETLSLIHQKGLLPMNRQYVHCSTDFATAQQVGQRKAKNPVILVIQAIQAHNTGISFYEGNASVWLADAIPPHFVDFPASAG